MTDKPQPFVVQPEWRGDRLYFGSVQFGSVTPASEGRWWALHGLPGTIPPAFKLKAEARAAVENAVREALGGKPV